MPDAMPPAGAPTPAPESASEKKPLLGRALDFAGELLHVVVISLAIIVPVRYFLIQPFYVKGASMEPNFYDHEYLIIDEIGYRLNQPQRGEIVVFRYPNDPRQYFIKRIIGLPGERIKVSGGQVWVYNAEHPDGKVLDEHSYLGAIYTSGEKDVQLADDEYFLMGDNRGASLDSRSFGPVTRSFIVGRVWFRGWPPEKIKVFTERPDPLD
ncbi:MAG TPA: signal peptidase I [Patescibacteria group bacterium]|nr:signal peptidase I [Patescibacteria group bacterium]